MIQTIFDTIAGYCLLAKLELLPFFKKKPTVPSDENKKLLLLAPFIPPYDNGGVYRPLSWLQYSEKFHWNSTVLTRTPPNHISDAGSYLLKHLPENLDIIYQSPSTLRPAWQIFPRTDGEFLSAVHTALNCYSKYHNNPPSVIVATGPSFDLFIAAYYLSKIFKAKLILDYRDEWTLSPFTNVSIGNADSYWEKRCLRHADKVIFTTQNMMQHHQQFFRGLIDHKSCVLHNGWEPQDITSATPSNGGNNENSPFIIMFAGTMGHATLPGQFLKNLQNSFDKNDVLKTKFKLHIIGTQVKEAKQQLNEFLYQDNLLVEGNFPKDIANKMIRESDVLLIITPSEMARYIPGKLIEYLASGKPIIVIGTPGESSEIVTQLDAGYFIAENDPGALEKALGDIASSEPSRWQNDKRQKWVEAHTRENLARDFFGILENI